MFQTHACQIDNLEEIKTKLSKKNEWLFKGPNLPISDRFKGNGIMVIIMISNFVVWTRINSHFNVTSVFLSFFSKWINNFEIINKINKRADRKACQNFTYL